jgi:molecular chaperone DnaJ
MKTTCHLYQKNITLEQAVLGGNFKIQIENGQMIRVLLKHGSFSGQVIRLKAAAGLNTASLPKDTFIKLHVMDHPFYRVNGLNLKASLLVTAAEAELGCTKKIVSPDGKQMDVIVMPKSKDGDHILIKNAGLSDKKKTGDIIFQIKIDFLDNVDDALLLADLTKQKMIIN